MRGSIGCGRRARVVTAHTDNYFAEQLAVIDAVLRMLNESDIPEDRLGGFHIRVTLHDEGGRKVGFFSDEIANTASYYQPEVTS